MKEFLEKSLENQNVRACAVAVRKCEGTDALDGYNYLFGSNAHNDRRFTDFSTHPNQKFPFGKGQQSDAAGAYQVMYATWVEDQVKLDLPDFSPYSQDLIFVGEISKKDCLQKLMDGKIYEVISHINKTWASLPNSPYGQPTHTMDEVINWYSEAGGTITDGPVL